MRKCCTSYCSKAMSRYLPWIGICCQSAAATEHAQGVLTAVHLPMLQRPIDNANWYVYADTIADPGNLGTIWRSAHATGASALLLSADSVDPFNPKVVRASMGAAFKLPVYRCQDNTDALALMEELGLARLCARANGMDVRDCGSFLLQPHVWFWERRQRVSAIFGCSMKHLALACLCRPMQNL